LILGDRANWGDGLSASGPSADISLMPRTIKACLLGCGLIGLAGCDGRDVVERVIEESTREVLRDFALERNPLTNPGTTLTGDRLPPGVSQMWTVPVKKRRLSIRTGFTNDGHQIRRRLEAREPFPTGRYKVVWDGGAIDGSLWADVVSRGITAQVALGFERRLLLMEVAPTTRGMYASEPTEILTPGDPIVGVRLQRSENRLHLLWAEDPLGAHYLDSRLFYASADLRGRNWSKPRCLSETAVIGMINLVTDRGEVFVGWTDHRFREGEGEWALNQAKAFIVRSPDDGDTFGHPVMLNEPADNEDNAALLYIAPAGEDLIVFWAKIRDGLVGNTWQHGILDRDLTTLRDWGPISGQEIVDAYRKRLFKYLSANVRATPESPYAD
jgi:hypothetical protein